MGLVLTIDVVCAGLLVITAVRKGFEGALPLTAFLMMLFPVESQIRLPGLFDLTTQRLLIVVLVVLYVVKGKPQKRPLPLKYLVLLLIAWMLVSSANSVVPDVAFKSTLSQLLDFVVPYYICAMTVSKVETVQKILFAFVAAMFVCSIFGLLEIYGGWSVVSLFPPVSHHFAYVIGEQGERGVRAQATFGHPILFGAALAMAIPLALYQLTIAETAARKLFLWWAIMLMALCIYKTGSRGPWIALGSSLAVLLILGRGQLRKYLLVIAMLTVTVLVVDPGVWDTIRNLYVASLDPETGQGESYQWRYLLYGVARRELAKDFGRSLWGYGPESFYYLGLTAQFYVEGEQHTVQVQSCDSAVVELMMDTGYVGLFIVAMLLLKAGHTAFRSFRSLPNPANALSLVLLTNICAFCFLMASVELFAWGQQAYMLWILLGLVMIYAGLAQAKSTSANEIAPELTASTLDLTESSLA
jgi:hypothetical protein